jgi:hypothetical protein
MGQRATIDALSNEVLLQVFENLTDPQIPYRFTWPLALTCKRFRQLAQPLVFSRIVLRTDADEKQPDNYSWLKTPQSTARARSRKLRNTLELASELKLHAKRVSVEGLTYMGFSEVVSIIKEFPNARRLDLQSIANEWDLFTSDGWVDVQDAPEKTLPPRVEHPCWPSYAVD